MSFRATVTSGWAPALRRGQPPVLERGTTARALTHPGQNNSLSRRRAALRLAAGEAEDHRRWRWHPAQATDGSSGSSGGSAPLQGALDNGADCQPDAASQAQGAGPTAGLQQVEQQQELEQQCLDQQTAAGPPPAAQQAAASSGNGNGAAQQAPPPPPPWLRYLPRWQLPDVPWALNTTITLMVVWLVCFWLSAYSLVPALLRWVGVEPSGSATQALRHLVLDSLQVATTVLLLWRGLAGFRPRALGLFAAPLRPLRAWLPAVAAGVATFPFVDWVHKRMVELMALEEAAAASGTAEQILGTSSAATHGLWFAVLAVCAPVWEELMFRGFLLPSLARYLPRWAALAATSLIFGLVHFSREGLLPLLLLGCVFGGAYAATRNLLAPIVLHSLWNVCLLVQLLRAGAGA